jgi:hypothetical protein
MGLNSPFIIASVVMCMWHAGDRESDCEGLILYRNKLSFLRKVKGRSSGVRGIRGCHHAVCYAALRCLVNPLSRGHE